MCIGTFANFGKDKYAVLKEIRDWALAGIFLLWGGQGVYQGYVRPYLNSNKPAKENKFDSLSDRQKEEAVRLMEEIGKLKRLNKVN